MNLFQTLREHRRLADSLRALPKDGLSPARRVVMRDQIVHAARTRPLSPTPSASPQPRSARFVFAIIAAALVLFLVTSTVLTAQAAGPGDALYGLNRAFDQLHFALALSPQGKADVAAAIAVKRQTELEKVQQKVSVTPAIQAQAEDKADEALDQAIIAVGKAKTHSDKNRTAIQNRAAQKVQHLIELRDKHRAKKAAQDAKQNVETTVPAPAGNSEKIPPGQVLHSLTNDDAGTGHEHGSE